MGSSEKREEKILTGVPPPLGVQAQHSSPTKWSTGLCSCDEDVGNCCLTCWCPCITFGRIAEITDRGATTCVTGGAIYALLLLVGFPCIYSCCYRSKLRKQYSLLERPCPDFLVHCCCEECALCQEYRELERRGYDMSAGWNDNVRKQTRGVTTNATTAPMIPGVMMR